MSWLGVLGVIISFCWFGAVPAHGQGCCHHNHHYDDADCWDGDHCWHQGAPAGRYFRGPGSSPGAANAQTVEGKIAEVVYLPGATVESGRSPLAKRPPNKSGPFGSVGILETERSGSERGRYHNSKGIRGCGDGGRPHCGDRSPQRRENLIPQRYPRAAGLAIN